MLEAGQHGQNCVCLGSAGLHNMTHDIEIASLLSRGFCRWGCMEYVVAWNMLLHGICCCMEYVVAWNMLLHGICCCMVVPGIDLVS